MTSLAFVLWGMVGRFKLPPGRPAYKHMHARSGYALGVGIVFMIGAIVRPDHPFAGRTQVSFKDCAEYPLVLPDRSWPLRRVLDDRLQALSIVPSVLTTSNSIEFLHSRINQQLGIGFQTAVGIERRLLAGELIMIPLHDPEPLYQRLSLCIATNHRTSDVFQFLLSLLQERLNSYADDWS